MKDLDFFFFVNACPVTHQISAGKYACNTYIELSFLPKITDEENIPYLQRFIRVFKCLFEIKYKVKICIYK